MDQSNFNFWSLVLQCFSVVVSVGVAVVVAWYTKETQLIRKQGQSQLGILQAQLQLGLAPYLIARVIEYAQGGQHVPHTALKYIRASHRCQICNPTDRPAHHVNALVYTANGNYFWSDQGFDSLGRTDGQDLVALGPLTRDDAMRAIQREYGQDANRYTKVFHDTARGYLAIFLRDVNGNLYVALRYVDFDGQATMHHTNRVLRPFGDTASADVA